MKLINQIVVNYHKLAKFTWVIFIHALFHALNMLNVHRQHECSEWIIWKNIHISLKNFYNESNVGVVSKALSQIATILWLIYSTYILWYTLTKKKKHKNCVAVYHNELLLYEGNHETAILFSSALHYYTNTNRVWRDKSLLNKNLTLFLLLSLLKRWCEMRKSISHKASVNCLELVNISFVTKRNLCVQIFRSSFLSSYILYKIIVKFKKNHHRLFAKNQVH